MGVKIYGVRALNCTHAIPFYEELSERSGAVSITFNSFKLIVDMFLAICYREASPEKLQAFEQEVKQEGKMSEELGNIFQTLAKPNQEKKKADKKKMKSSESWYDISKDKGNAEYKWDQQSNQWVTIGYRSPKPDKKEEKKRRKEKGRGGRETKGKRKKTKFFTKTFWYLQKIITNHSKKTVFFSLNMNHI